MLNRRLFAALFVLLGSITGAQAADAIAAQSGFVTVKGKHFELDGKPYYFAGANLWYGMYLGSPGKTGNRARLTQGAGPARRAGHHESARAGHLRVQHAEARRDAGGDPAARITSMKPCGRASISCSPKWRSAT